MWCGTTEHSAAVGRGREGNGAFEARSDYTRFWGNQVSRGSGNTGFGRKFTLETAQDFAVSLIDTAESSMKTPRSRSFRTRRGSNKRPLIAIQTPGSRSA